MSVYSEAVRSDQKIRKLKHTGLARTVFVALMIFGFGAVGDAEVSSRFTEGSLHFTDKANWTPAAPGKSDDVTIRGIQKTATLQLNTSPVLGSFIYKESAGNLAVIGYGGDRTLSMEKLMVDAGGRTLTLRDGNGKLAVNAGALILENGSLQLGTSGHPLEKISAGSISVGKSSTVMIRRIGSPAEFGDVALQGTVQLNAGAAQDSPNRIVFSGLTGTGRIKVRDGGEGVNQAELIFGNIEGTFEFNGDITDKDMDADRLNLIKTGSGAQVLAGAGSYRGTTLVREGKLLIKGDLSSAPGPVTVAAGAVLGGTGTIGGDLVLEDGAGFFFDAGGPLTVNGTVVNLGDLSVTRLSGVDGTVPAGTYSLIVPASWSWDKGEIKFNLADVQNMGADQSQEIGGGKRAYFEKGKGLNLVIVSAAESVKNAARSDQKKVSEEATDFSAHFTSFMEEGYPLPAVFSVPFAEGRITSPSQIRIQAEGADVPQQWRVLGYWPDQSVKWAQVVCPAASVYQVVASGVGSPEVADPVQVRQFPGGASAVITSGAVSLQITNSTAILRSGAQELSFSLSQVTAVNGDILNGRVESLDVLESGPMRAAVRAKGLHRSAAHPDGFLQFDVLLTLYAGSATVEVDHTLVVISGNQTENLSNEMMFFKSARIPVRLSAADTPVSFSTYESSVNEFKLTAGERIFQTEDFSWAIEGSGGVTQQGERADGVLIATGPSGSSFASVLDFWQQYPKGYTARADGFDIDLFPFLSLGGTNPYEGREDEHIWYYYLRSGNYELRQGVSKSHRLFIGLRSTPAEALQSAGPLRSIPVVLPDQAYVHSTKAAGDMAPPFSGGLFSEWDQAFLDGVASYFSQQQELRWYGLLNWGDWLGERSYNWSNHEYDFPETLFKQALRFGNPDFMREAIRENSHRRDVDIIHAHGDPKMPGINWKHSLGHTGGYYPDVTQRKFALSNYGHGDAAFFDGSSTPGHTRTASFFTDYFLTGNPRSLETGRLVADRLMQYDLITKDNFNYMTAREPGWSMVSLTAAYRATGDAKYLNGANRMADLVISKSAGNGVWLRKLAPHQRGPEPENGELSFPAAFQAAGMISLYEITGRPEVKENILQTADYILNYLYRPEYKAFVHSPSRERTQTPRAGGTAGTNLRYILAYAYGVTGDGKFADPVIDCFASMAANRQWCGTKVDPDRPYPHEIASSFYFLNEDQAAMDRVVGALFRNQKKQVLERAASADIFPELEPWENVY